MFVEPRTYKFIAQIEQELAEEKLRPIRAAEDYSYIGEHQLALIMEGGSTDDGLNISRPTASELIAFQAYKAVDAIPFLTQQAKDQKIVIFNESHYNPVNRVFLELMLDSLYATGFRYLGFEAINMNPYDSTRVGELDTALNERGYPYSHPFSTGTYTCEPQFGNLIRRAIQKDFHVFGYEVTSYQRQIGMRRDSAEATNVQRFLNQDPDAKIILFCGFGHLFEKIVKEYCPPENPGCIGGRWLGYYINTMLGIDPLTINQESLTERIKEPESSFYKMITSDKPSALVKESGEIFKGPGDHGYWDISVYHPRTKYIKGRPNWLLRDGKFKHYEIDASDIQIDCPCQVRAFYANEPDTATPADIIELSTNGEQRALVLPAGKFYLLLHNQNGEKQRLEIEVK